MNKQTLYRLWHTLRLWMIPDSEKRANYIKKSNLFHHMGDACTIMERKVPLYPNLISIGNNVHLASKVCLVPHDAIHLCLNSMGASVKEKIGCIEIGDNVFIGANTTVLYDVKIGSNVIIGAGSLVNRDIPDNSVAVGIPARVIGTFEDFKNNRQEEGIYPAELTPVGYKITKGLEDWCWNDFNARRKRF